MTLLHRNNLKWSINEVLALQREYELLGMSIQDISEKHQRTIEAILFKLQQEKFIETWIDATGYQEYSKTQSTFPDSFVYKSDNDDDKDSDYKPEFKEELDEELDEESEVDDKDSDYQDGIEDEESDEESDEEESEVDDKDSDYQDEDEDEESDEEESDISVFDKRLSNLESGIESIKKMIMSLENKLNTIQ